MIIIVGKYLAGRDCKDQNVYDYNDSIFIDDRFIFHFLNGETRINNTSCVNSPKQLMEALVKKGKDKKKEIVLHTFNISILNCFSMEDAVHNFYCVNDNNELIKLFSLVKNKEKFAHMKPGYAVEEIIYN